MEKCLYASEWWCCRGGFKTESELKKSEKENKKLAQELNRKEKALAEAAALLVLRKNADAIWGEPEDE